MMFEVRLKAVRLHLQPPDGYEPEGGIFVDHEAVTKVSLHLTQYSRNGKYERNGFVTVPWDDLPEDMEAYEMLSDEIKAILEIGDEALG